MRRTAQFFEIFFKLNKLCKVLNKSVVVSILKATDVAAFFIDF